MVRFTGGLLLFSAWSLAAPTDPAGVRNPPQGQQVLSSKPKIDPASPRKLQGRFLHITDLHPDPFYKRYSSSENENACHSGSGEAGVYGAEMTDCDSPFRLINATFQWINNNLKDNIDFVIWTGDSARHDNDEHHPRTDKQVVHLNTYAVSKFVEVFGKPDNIDDPDPTNDFVVPIIPTFGNNDILPHNIFEPGPNLWTRTYETIWEKFIPQEQRHSFARGGWFFTEVIPNKLAVFSLNTLYFFDSNAAVDGCDDESEPGYEHMEWLRIQLQFLRDRGMKAILTGHVPPARTESKKSWDESCWQKYTLWMREYRDVIAGAVFGHMNMDHFMLQDVRDLKYDFRIKEHDNKIRGNDTFSIAAKATYLNELRHGWANLPKPPHGMSYSTTDEDLDDAEIAKKKKDKKKKKSKKQKKKKFLKEIGGKWAERYSLTIVSPSVVPNFYPTLRVVEYNITGLEDGHPAASPYQGAISPFWFETDDDDAEHSDDLGDVDTPALGDVAENSQDLTEMKKKKGKKKKPPHKPPFPVPKPPSKSAPPGPAYSPQTFTFLSYTQYFANLTRINDDVKKSGWSDEPVGEAAAGQKRRPHTYAHFRYEIEYDTRNDSMYHMHDLTVRNYLDLAERMGREVLKMGEEEGDESSWWRWKWPLSSSLAQVRNQLWRMFVKRAFVMTKTDVDLDESFKTIEK